MSALSGMRLGLIVGAMKSGTTSLYELLVQHPQVCACAEKEPGFFSHDERWARGASWYRGLWGPSLEPGMVALEASTHYTKSHRHPQTVQRIASVIDDTQDMRFIYIMRDPVERMISHYRHLVRMGDIEDRGRDMPRLDAVVSVGRYATEIGAYIDRFGRDRVLLLALERLRCAPDETLARTARFLQVDDSFRFHEAASVHNPGLRDHPVLTRIAWLPGASSVASLLPRRMKLGIRRLTARKSDNEPVAVAPDIRAALVEEIRPEIVRLRDEFGFDTSCWRSAQPDQA